MYKHLNGLETRFIEFVEKIDGSIEQISVTINNLNKKTGKKVVTILDEIQNGAHYNPVSF